MEYQVEQTVSSYCRTYSLFTNGTILVALSGGSDSVALLHILKNLGGKFDFTLAAAHLNHALRERASDNDETFCRAICKKLDIPLIVENLPEGFLEKKHDSLETAARETRIAFLEKTAADIGAKRIATGHTCDDQAETVLQRILRGTGPSGLSGIQPERDNLWIRPLLSVTRSELRDYLSEINCGYREDESNADTTFFRNHIRHNLLPFLQKDFSPNITQNLASLAELSFEQEKFLENVVRESYDSCLIHEDSHKILLDKRGFMAYHTFLRQRIIRLALVNIEGIGRDTDRKEIKTVLDVFSRNKNNADITACIRCESIGDCLAFARKDCTFDSVVLNTGDATVIPCDGGTIISERISGISHVDGRQQIVVDGGIEETYGSLTVGTIHKGDTITPYGSPKTVKIRKLFSDESVPVIFRNMIPVVRAGAVPIWIPGLRSSDILRHTVSSSITGNRYLLRYEKGLVWRKTEE